ncbi:D-alanyl-D-alanine carboxypeptidase family protein [Tianweitania sediminis]|uniref:D-alanyl-D-alanine carboxypeptidase n=1 Tax=Tianweitania sediminis TaxID=1502156 RepID=A0A8J7QZS9_9HYPH|nr:D-alanyl-D-alanine carboxypeptidase family protein [Tianweitania sediminis]MBP0437878.1 D-alanyl-D-alanine carboxypeptidase [Tianweitania sediminis]
MIVVTRRLLAAVLSAGLLASTAFGAAWAGPSIVVDTKSGRVLSQEDAFKRWYPASLTKLMSVYVAFRAIQAGEITLLSPIEISKNALREPPSKMAYPVGSVLSVDNAIKIMMVKSANDVATALGETVGGSERGFAERMNKEAARLGMTGSHFVNAHGLHDDNHYSTAHDLAVLATAIRRDFPDYADYFDIEAIAAGDNVMPNHNDLIGRFEGADGMKTGYTCPAGFNVTASATRNGRQVIAVVLGAVSPDARAYRTAELLTEGLSANEADKPLLAELRPTGENLSEAGNMRADICTEEAQQRIAKTRDANGKPLVPSPFLSELTRPRVVVSVGLGGATGPKSTQPRYADVPIPTPRPEYAPDTAAIAATEQGG